MRSCSRLPESLFALSCALFSFALLVAACPAAQPVSSPPASTFDPTEYVYEITGTGSLVMGDDSVRTLSLVLSNSSSPDFHVSSSFSSRLRVYAYFDGGPLCLYIQLSYDGSSWSARSTSGQGYCYIANGPYPDGFVSSLPYSIPSTTMAINASPSDKAIIASLSFTSAKVTAFTPTVSGYAGAIKSVSVNLAFSAPLGYGLVDHTSSASVDSARFMDTRARLASVPAPIDAGLKADPVAYAPQLTQALIQGLTDPIEKMRVIHDWIAENVYYDEYWYETYYLSDPAGNYDEFVAKSPCAVLKERKTVCGGYSLLFWYLCRLEGIHAQVIRGYTRSPSAPTTMGDHTWNIVSINGAMYHIDTTADSPNRYTVAKAWVASPQKAEWFLPPSELFCMWRNPYEAAHRYPGQYSTGEGFYASALPSGLYTAGSYLTKDFFALGYSLGSGASALIKANSIKTIQFSLPVGPPPVLLADVIHASSDSTADSTESYVERADSSAKIIIDPRYQGYRMLRLYHQSGADWICLGRFIVKEEGGSPASQAFPRHYSDYFSLGAALASPLRDNLSGGTSVSFDLYVPGGTRFYIGSGALGYSYYDVAAEALRGSFPIPAGSGLCYVGVYVGGNPYTILGYTLP